MTTSNDVRFRWAEILLTMTVSAGCSALAVTWSVSATLTKMQMEIESFKSKQAGQEATISNLSSQAALQSTQIAVSDANYKNIITWLAEIKEELRKKR